MNNVPGSQKITVKYENGKKVRVTAMPHIYIKQIPLSSMGRNA